MATLSPKHRRFVDEYLIDRNATAAYKRAGYIAKGNSAEVNASRLLKRPQVRAAIDKAEGKRSARTGITSDRVLQALEKLAFPDRRAKVSDVVKLRALELAGQHVGLFVKRLKVEVDEIPAFRLILDDGD